VFVTSLYSFRLYFLVFHGKERFDTVHGPAHVHHDEGRTLAAHGHDAHGHDGHAHGDHGHDAHHGGGLPKESPWVVTLPLVLLAARSVRGGSEVFVYARDRDGLFAAVTATLDRLHLSVQEARIVTSRSGMSLDTFLVLDAQGRPLDAGEAAEHAAALREVLCQVPYRTHPVRRSPARTLKHFPIPPRIALGNDVATGHTQLSLVCSDRPGLLATVAQVLRECGVRVHDARIATFGERAEDMFLIAGADDRALDPAQAEQALRDALLAVLDGDPR